MKQPQPSISRLATVIGIVACLTCSVANTALKAQSLPSQAQLKALLLTRSAELPAGSAQWTVSDDGLAKNVLELLTAANFPFDIHWEDGDPLSIDDLVVEGNPAYTSVIIAAPSADFSGQTVASLLQASETYGVSLVGFYTQAGVEMDDAFAIDQRSGVAAGGLPLTRSSESRLTAGLVVETIPTAASRTVVSVLSGRVSMEFLCDGDPAIFRADYGAATNYYFAPDAAWWLNESSALHEALRRALTHNSGHPFALVRCDHGIMLRMDDPGASVRHHLDSWLYRGLDSTEWAQISAVLQSHDAVMNVGYVAGWVDDGNPDRGDLYVDGELVTERTPGTRYESQRVAYDGAFGWDDHGDEYAGLLNGINDGVISIESHGDTHIDINRNAWAVASNRYSAVCWYREFFHNCLGQSLSPAEQIGILDRSSEGINGWFGTWPTTMIPPGHSLSNDSGQVIQDYGYLFTAAQTLALPVGGHVLWNDRIRMFDGGRDEQEGYPVVRYFHDRDIALEGVGWLDSLLAQTEGFDPKVEYLSFRELAGRLLSTIDAVREDDAVSVTVSITGTGGVVDLAAGRYFNAHRLPLTIALPRDHCPVGILVNGVAADLYGWDYRIDELTVWLPPFAGASEATVDVSFLPQCDQCLETFQYDDCGDRRNQPHQYRGSVWTFPGSLPIETRTISYDASHVGYRYYVNPTVPHVLTAELYAYDGQRIEAIEIDGVVVAEALDLNTPGTLLNVSRNVPASALSDGVLDVRILNRSGDNAVVSQLWVTEGAVTPTPGPSPAPSPTPPQSAYEDCGNPALQPDLVRGNNWTFSGSFPLETRTINYHSQSVIYLIELDPYISYRLRAEFYAMDGSRTMSIEAEGKTLVEEIDLTALESYRVIEADLPAAVVADGWAEVEFINLTGDNAVVSQIWVEPSDPMTPTPFHSPTPAPTMPPPTETPAPPTEPPPTMTPGPPTEPPPTEPPPTEPPPTATGGPPTEPPPTATPAPPTATMPFGTSTPGFTPVELYYEDCGQPGAQPHLVRGNNWTFPGAQPVETRTVNYHADAVIYAFPVNPTGSYLVTCEFYTSDGLREQGMDIEGTRLATIDLLAPLSYRLVERMAPAEAVADGSLELEIVNLAGDNAVVSRIWIHAVEPGMITPTATPGLPGAFYDDCGQAGTQPHLVTGSNWLFPGAQSTETRSINYHAQAVVYDYELNPALQWTLTVELYAFDGQRRQSVNVDGVTLQDDIDLTAPGAHLILDWTLPPSLVNDGRITLSIINLFGHNAVVSQIWLDGV